MSFDWMAFLIQGLDQNAEGYELFTVAKYGIALAVMLPATFCAGITLPLITRMLLNAGSGERAVGAVYSVNTFGSIVGAGLAALVLMPLLGLKTQAPRKTAVMRQDRVFAQSFAKMMRDAFGEAARVDEHQCGAIFIRERGDAIVDLGPHFGAGDGAQFIAGNLDRDIHRAAMTNPARKTSRPSRARIEPAVAVP